jgi:hypothetical protein
MGVAPATFAAIGRLGAAKYPDARRILGAADTDPLILLAIGFPAA